MKILVTCDWHAGLVVGGYDAYEDLFGRDGVVWQVVEATREADLLVIAGDVFHGPRPKPRENTAVIRALQEVKCPFVAIPGNHDEASGLEPDALEPLRVSQFNQDCAMPKWPTSSVLGLGETFAFVPYMNDTKATHYERVKGEFPTTLLNPPASSQDLVDGVFRELLECRGLKGVFAHHDLEGAVAGTEARLLRGKRVALPPAAFDLGCRVVNGHIHRRQRLRNVWMPGSLLPTDMDEREDQKGYMILEV